MGCYVYFSPKSLKNSLVKTYKGWYGVDMIEYLWKSDFKILRAIQERRRTREGRKGGNPDHLVSWIALFVLRS